MSVGRENARTTGLYSTFSRFRSERRSASVCVNRTSRRSRRSATRLAQAIWGNEERREG